MPNKIIKPSQNVSFLFYQTDKTYSTQWHTMQNYGLWDCSLTRNPSSSMTICVRAIKSDTSTQAVTQHRGSWAITWHCHLPISTPSSNSHTTRVNMRSKEKGGFGRPKFMVLACIAFPLSVFLNSPPILSLLPHSEECNPCMWLVFSVYVIGLLADASYT